MSSEMYDFTDDELKKIPSHEKFLDIYYNELNRLIETYHKFLKTKFGENKLDEIEKYGSQESLKILKEIEESKIDLERHFFYHPNLFFDFYKSR